MHPIHCYPHHRDSHAVVHLVEVAREGILIKMDQHEFEAASKPVGKSLKELTLSKRAGGEVCTIQRKEAGTIYEPVPECVPALGERFETRQ